MNLKDVASVSGKPGLFKVVKPTRTGVILETIDGQKSRIVANANNRVSILQEISIYTTGKEASIPLEKVFTMIYEKFNKSLKVDSKSEPQALKAFLSEIVPDYDTERVYNSDIKKLVGWYLLIASYLPEVFTSIAEEKEKSEEKPKKEAGRTEDTENVKPKSEKAVKPEKKEEEKTVAKTKSKTTKSK